MMISKDLIILFLITYYIPLVLSKCQLSIQDADKCGMKAMFFGNRDTIVPTNDQEMDQHCSIVNENMKCIRDFVSTCLVGFLQQTMNMALTNAGKHIDKRCKDPQERQDFITHVKCLNPKDKMEPLHICADKNLVMMEKLRDIEEKDRISAGCCIFHSYQDCIRDHNKQICGEESSNYWDEVINDIAEDSISFSCANFESVAKCEKSLNPKIWNELKTVAASDDPNILAARHKFGSGIALTIELLDNFSM